jgi:hypothetical protein
MFGHRSLDDALRELETEVASLSRRPMAAFYTAAAESLARISVGENELSYAAICNDIAKQCADPHASLKSEWVEYVLTPAIQTVCAQETGFIDLGTTSEAKTWNAQALQNPKLKSAFDACFQMLTLLKGHEKITTETRARLRTLADALVV